MCVGQLTELVHRSAPATHSDGRTAPAPAVVVAFASGSIIAPLSAPVDACCRRRQQVCVGSIRSGLGRAPSRQQHAVGAGRPAGRPAQVGRADDNCGNCSRASPGRRPRRHIGHFPFQSPPPQPSDPHPNPAPAPAGGWTLKPAATCLLVAGRRVVARARSQPIRSDRPDLPSPARQVSRHQLARPSPLDSGQ